MRIRHPLLLLSAAALLALAAVPSIGMNGLNSRFIKWPEKTNVIHLFGFSEPGRPGYGAATVKEGQWVLFGFEWSEPTVEELQALVDNTGHDLTVSINEGAPLSVKDWYQDPFIAEVGTGPRWSWDHDGDGRGDGNGDGLGDWDGPILFFRYLYSGLTVGTHTFEFTIIDPEFPHSEVITVEVVAED